MVGIRQVAYHLQLDRLGDRHQPEVPRIPLRVKAIESKIAGVAGAEPAVADALPRQFDRDVAGRTAVDECRDVFLFEEVVEDGNHPRVGRFVMQHTGNGRRERCGIDDVEVAGRDVIADDDGLDDP